eukprot:CAMPEP_0183532212 /NCGR_PEP_ID=MMETSP0371-20130417/25349_1 /TAXON_ID=268820 /ORGANISM="Peridinium aciculiferum, Strain PAER-2" /LENGTH=76 /DNA_ID=CAMNT_0025732323 /DNA_START=21 /DNA_END=247 /DNA_ORIENTATION=+
MMRTQAEQRTWTRPERPQAQAPRQSPEGKGQWQHNEKRTGNNKMPSPSPMHSAHRGEPARDVVVLRNGSTTTVEPA